MSNSLHDYYKTNCGQQSDISLQKDICSYAKVLLHSNRHKKHIPEEHKLVRSLNDIQEKINTYKKSMNELTHRKNLIHGELGHINRRESDLITSNRMLELGKEKNEYNQKMIYTIFSGIIGLFLLLLILYKYLR